MSGDLVKMEELAKAATPGPWKLNGFRLEQVCDSAGFIVATATSTPSMDERSLQQRAEDQAAFIAAANPATVLSMVATIRALQEQLKTAREDAGNRKFNLGDRVEKISGSSWRGYIVGFYATTLTPEGYAVESENEPGSVQIYPVTAIRALKANGEKAGT